MRIIVGVFAYNEGKNLSRCIGSFFDQTAADGIDKIVIYADGCTDDTLPIAQRLMRENPRISIVEHPQRQGKVSRVREFIMSHHGYDALVVASADIVLDPACLEKMVRHLQDSRCGIVGARVLPSIDEAPAGPMRDIARVQWALHDRISRKRPKFGELIVFRNLDMDIGPGAVDEEQVAQAIRSLGYSGRYEPEAIVHNFPPASARALFEQRRRIWCGHLELKSRTGYQVPTIAYAEIARAMCAVGLGGGFRPMLTAMAIELPAMLLGHFDHWTDPGKHYQWKKVS